MPSPGATRSIADNNGLGAGTLGTSGFTGTVTERGNSYYHRTNFEFSGSVTLVNHGTNGSMGSVKLYDFPLGATEFFGGIGSLTLTTAATNVAATAAAVVSVGSADGSAVSSSSVTTLTSTLADMIQSTAFTLSGSTKTATMVGTVTPTIVDGTTTNKSLYLNVGIPQLGATGGALMTVSGIVKANWLHIGAQDAHLVVP